MTSAGPSSQTDEANLAARDLLMSVGSRLAQEGGDIRRQLSLDQVCDRGCFQHRADTDADSDPDIAQWCGDAFELLIQRSVLFR